VTKVNSTWILFLPKGLLVVKPKLSKSQAEQDGKTGLADREGAFAKKYNGCSIARCCLQPCVQKHGSTEALSVGEIQSEVMLSYESAKTVTPLKPSCGLERCLVMRM